jgi:hypothetical protein
VADDPALVVTANRAFELTRPVHYAQDSADLEERSDRASEAVDSFIALAAAEVQSAAGVAPHRRPRQGTGMTSQEKPIQPAGAQGPALDEPPGDITP